MIHRTYVKSENGRETFRFVAPNLRGAVAPSLFGCVINGLDLDLLFLVHSP